MKKLFLFICVLFISFNLFSKDQEILSIDSNLYDYIDYIYILDNKIPPTAVKPYSIGQMKVYLNSLNYNGLNKTAKKYYQYVSKELNKENLDIRIDDLSSLDIEASGGFEIYSHNNNEDINTHRDWILSQEERIPLLKLNLKIALDDFFFTSSNLQYSQGKYEPSNEAGYYLKDSSFFNTLAPYGIGSTAPNNSSIIYNIKTNQYNKNFSINIPQQSKYIDFDTPKRAIFSIGGKNWNFNYSKDKIDWGNSIIGNFIFDDHINNNFINLKVFSKNFNLNNTIAFLNTQTASGESPDTSIKMYMTHRLEFIPFNFLRFAVSENVMYKNTSPIFLYFNPSYIYHNINMRGMFNAIASFESEILLFNKVNWYTQFVLDQARAPNEDNSQSAAWGLSSGLNYVQSINNDILSLTAEALITLPCLYRRDEVDFISFDRTFVINQSYVIEPTYIGYKEGGDSVSFKIQGVYDSLNKFKATMYYSLLLKGEVNIFTPTHINNDLSTSNDDKPNYGETIFKNGIYSIKHIINSSLNYTLLSNKYINIQNKTSLSYIYYKELQPSIDTYSDLQLSLGILIKY